MKSNNKHGHSHGGEPCHGHDHEKQVAAQEKHGHSHGGEPCHGHGQQVAAQEQHGHSHGGKAFKKKNTKNKLGMFCPIYYVYYRQMGV